MSVLRKRYRLAIIALPAVAVFFLICGCGGTREVIREVPVEVPIYHTTATHDTIREYHHTTTDRTKDTVYKIEVHEYRHIHHDTVHDSTAFPVYLHDTIDRTDHAALAREKALRKESQAREIYAWLAVAILVAVILFFIRKRI